MKAPFPWFGGKSKIAPEIWDKIGPVDNYVEPFAGSLACLLMRPDDRWQDGAETVNDADCYLCNFWRALAADPEQTAHYADWPVNECDLLARHLWLVNTGRERIAKMEADPDFYDPKVAGWWVWGINAWIGSGWCNGGGPWKLIDGSVQAGSAGRGVKRKRPHLGDAGQGVNRQRPHLGNAGQGVNRKRPGGQLRTNPRLEDYFIELATRLRRVRVCCGDWQRVITNGALAFGDTVGIFLDPPYQGDVRTKDLYRVDDHSISNDVREWAIANGRNERYRIVLAGYADEHEMPQDWTMLKWEANRAYGTANGTDSDNATNRKNERLWFSPHCLRPRQEVLQLT